MNAEHFNLGSKSPLVIYKTNHMTRQFITVQILVPWSKDECKIVPFVWCRERHALSTSQEKTFSVQSCIQDANMHTAACINMCAYLHMYLPYYTPKTLD